MDKSTSILYLLRKSYKIQCLTGLSLSLFFLVKTKINKSKLCVHMMNEQNKSRKQYKRLSLSAGTFCKELSLYIVPHFLKI